MTSSMLLVALAALLMADCALAQTFSYSRGWKSGKRAGPAAVGGVAGAGVTGNAVGGLGPAGRTADDVLIEDLPLYRYFLEGRGEHRVPYDPWRIVEEPLVHFARRPTHREASEQPGDHDDS